MNGEAKITRVHRERLAVVYLRQSSMAQVRQHTESTMRQYALAEEAARLGWAPADVRVIDTDLGISGRWGVAREGFAELVRLVCRGEVGAIFSDRDLPAGPLERRRGPADGVRLRSPAPC